MAEYDREVRGHDASCAVHINDYETEIHRQGRLIDPFGAHSAGIRGYGDLHVLKP